MSHETGKVRCKPPCRSPVHDKRRCVSRNGESDPQGRLGRPFLRRPGCRTHRARHAEPADPDPPPGAELTAELTPGGRIVVRVSDEPGTELSPSLGWLVAGLRAGGVPEERWKAVRAERAGEIESLVDLLSRKPPKRVMKMVSRPGEGLFPSPKEIRLSCSPPDWAAMGKHVAAAMYGVGVRRTGWGCGSTAIRSSSSGSAGSAPTSRCARRSPHRSPCRRRTRGSPPTTSPPSSGWRWIPTPRIRRRRRPRRRRSGRRRRRPGSRHPGRKPHRAANKAAAAGPFPGAVLVREFRHRGNGGWARIRPRPDRGPSRSVALLNEQLP